VEFIEIDFEALTYIVVGLFAVIGLSRGWFREAFTTILLTAMVFMLIRPAFAARIVRILFAISQAITDRLISRLVSDPGRIQEGLDTLGGLLNVDNPYSFMLALTAFLIFVSYALGKRSFGEAKLAPLSRLLGGTLGAINGFIVISLIRKYLLTQLGFDVSPTALRAPGSVQAAQAPQQVGVVIQDLYNPSLLSNVLFYVLLAVGFIILIFFLRELQTRRAQKG
jgi:hypothetical protein